LGRKAPPATNLHLISVGLRPLSYLSLFHLQHQYKVPIFLANQGTLLFITVCHTQPSNPDFHYILLYAAPRHSHLKGAFDAGNGNQQLPGSTRNRGLQVSFCIPIAKDAGCCILRLDESRVETSDKTKTKKLAPTASPGLPSFSYIPMATDKTTAPSTAMLVLMTCPALTTATARDCLTETTNGGLVISSEVP